ncbi:MAG: hypothetical protein EA413_06935 [Cyanobium sp. PLM2.Bin73]|nr:MAG: hypothetical protein EA413_06935 [Cyanobium sp. PLM2.Bin73]
MLKFFLNLMQLQKKKFAFFPGLLDVVLEAIALVFCRIEFSLEGIALLRGDRELVLKAIALVCDG